VYKRQPFPLRRSLLSAKYQESPMAEVTAEEAQTAGGHVTPTIESRIAEKAPALAANRRQKVKANALPLRFVHTIMILLKEPNHPSELTLSRTCLFRQRAVIIPSAN